MPSAERWSIRAAISAWSVSGIAVAVAALDEHPDRLLDEQRVAFGAVEKLLRQRQRLVELGDERRDELLALRLGQRLELDRRRADAASSPARAHVEQLGPREAEDEQRRAAPSRPGAR